MHPLFAKLLRRRPATPFLAACPVPGPVIRPTVLLPVNQDVGVRLRIDPKDHRRVRISGSMREVCAALDALIATQ